MTAFSLPSPLRLPNWSSPAISTGDRDQRRGYSVDKKRIAFAYTAELVVIVTSLFGQWLLTRKYGHDAIDMQMMMLAPISYAVIEICRVPLAISVRAHASTFVRIIALIGVIFASGVTVKSMSMLGEIMFRPRLEDVRQSKAALDQATAALVAVDGQVADADNLVTKSRDEADTKEQRAKNDPALLMSVPKPQCHQTKSINRDGKEVWGQVCAQDPRAKTITDNLARNAAERKAAYDAVVQAVAARKALIPVKAAADTAVAKAKHLHATAVKDFSFTRSPAWCSASAARRSRTRRSTSSCGSSCSSRRSSSPSPRPS